MHVRLMPHGNSWTPTNIHLSDEPVPATYSTDRGDLESVIYHDEHYIIRKDVPMPEKQPTDSSATTYSFGEMEVGNSFTFPEVDRNRVTAASSLYGKRNGMRFAIRDLGGKLGCWRIA